MAGCDDRRGLPHCWPRSPICSKSTASKVLLPSKRLRVWPVTFPWDDAIPIFSMQTCTTPRSPTSYQRVGRHDNVVCQMLKKQMPV
jgi:hypothetical protein